MRLRCNPTYVVFLTILVVFGCLGSRGARAAITFGQLDDFQDGTNMGWDQGFSTPSPTTNVDNGRRGAGDRFLQNVSAGGFGAGSKQTMFNQAQWTGDYNAAGVTRLSGWVANLGATDLHVRVALEGKATQFGSSRAFDLPAASGWRHVTFDLTPSSLALIQGTASLADALSGVTELRLISAAAGPSFRGDVVASTLGLDDLRAMRPEGDANFDGRIDNADLQVARSHLGSGAAAGATWADGDFNFDGRVNAKDMALLRRDFGLGVTPSAVASVLPEPSSFLVLGLPLLALLRRRR